jgi:hypothetical protein
MISRLEKRNSAAKAAQLSLRFTAWLNRLRKNALYEGHGFSRAVQESN